jgi:AcrR family transcriptional regulator
MARPVDATLRARLLEDVLGAVSRMGLGNLALRPLAREAGVRPRTLLYHFGSRDGLMDAVVAETSRRLAVAASGLDGPLPLVVRASWTWMTDPEQRGFVNVFYDVCALGARDPARRGAVASSLFIDWQRLLVSRGLTDASATLLLTTLHGLLLDLVLTNEGPRIERALVALVATLPSQKARAS